MSLHVTVENHQVSLRIVLLRPPHGVEFAVQRGSNELLSASARSPGKITFEFSMRLGARNDVVTPRFLGDYAQGPPSARFVYVNSGKRAGQSASSWDRRAKIPLAGITMEMVAEAMRDGGARIETSFEATARDGGPTCATVKGIAWRVA